METIRGATAARRLVFGIFAVIAAVLIVRAVIAFGAASPQLWLIATVGVLCAGLLDMPRFRLGRLPHQTPVISLPIVVMLALAPAFTPWTALGLTCLGVLAFVLVRSRRPEIALFASGVVGVGGIAAIGVQTALQAAGLPLAVVVAGAALGYQVTVIVIEGLRRHFDKHGEITDAPYSVPRVLVIVLGYALLCGSIAVWPHPFIEMRTSTIEVAATLLPLAVVGTGAILIIRAMAMRRRLAGVVAGVIDLNATNHYTHAGEWSRPSSSARPAPAPTSPPCCCTRSPTPSASNRSVSATTRPAAARSTPRWRSACSAASTWWPAATSWTCRSPATTAAPSRPSRTPPTWSSPPGRASAGSPSAPTPTRSPACPTTAPSRMPWPTSTTTATTPRPSRCSSSTSTTSNG
ncbi:hypothetical protein BJQ94_02620 [Cryobacterium sp. SO2]|uniref:hypothetical protein n=1 Tax=Cryobacterium sp. SO2 TaxID=1897060 RepID=UPI0023D9A9CE|nr:hypothetical protein [Cryobacterium sp. SO2]WEO77953.1 hypothetical protein BJQ94_02620 [Cryobacterium sp. SO2]